MKMLYFSVNPANKVLYTTSTFSLGSGYHSRNDIHRIRGLWRLTTLNPSFQNIRLWEQSWGKFNEPRLSIFNLDSYICMTRRAWLMWVASLHWDGFPGFAKPLDESEQKTWGKIEFHGVKNKLLIWGLLLKTSRTAWLCVPLAKISKVECLWTIERTNYNAGLERNAKDKSMPEISGLRQQQSRAR